MSPIGKIFLLVNFGLAFGFLFWASTAVSSNARWKAQFEQERAAYEAFQAASKGELSNLQIGLTNERDAKDSRTQERDQAVAEASRNREELEKLKRVNEQLGADVAAIKETLDGYNQTNKALVAAKDAAAAEARDLERERNDASRSAEDAEKARADAEEALRTSQARIAALEKQLTSTKASLASAEAQIETAVSQLGVPLDQLTAQPDIEARVLQVDTSIQPGLVALNVGTSSGVKRGMTFQVYNGPEYKGYVRVENVHDNMCSALIVGQVGGRSIGQGDSAATNL